MKFLNLLLSLMLLLSLKVSSVKAEVIQEPFSNSDRKLLCVSDGTVPLFYIGDPSIPLLQQIVFLLQYNCERADILADLLKQIIEQGIDINDSIEPDFPPLYYATLNNDLTSIRLLLNTGADTNTSTEGGPVWLQNVDHRSIERIHLFLNTGRVNVNDTFRDRPAICIIKATNNNRLLQRMIDMGADPNEEC